MSEQAEYDRLRHLLARTKSPTARRAIVSQMQVISRHLTESRAADALRHQIRSCRACPLARTRNKAVPFVGPTHGNGDLIIVGEAPGPSENRRGEPFVGRAGRALDKLLTQAGTSRDRCFIMNALCCLPLADDGGFREPDQTELDACRPNFDDQLEMSGLKVGVALGGYAWAAVTKQERRVIRVAKLIEAETVAWVDGRIWIPTFHPSYALRKSAVEEEEGATPTIADQIVRSIHWALAIVKGNTLLPRIPWARVEFEGQRSESIAAGLKKKGWALVDSQTFGCQIVVTDPYIAPKHMPKAVAELIPQYTTEELWQLGLVGARRGGWTVGDLRRLHYTKVELGGEVVL